MVNLFDRNVSHEPLAFVTRAREAKKKADSSEGKAPLIKQGVTVARVFLLPVTTRDENASADTKNPVKQEPAG